MSTDPSASGALALGHGQAPPGDIAEAVLPPEQVSLTAPADPMHPINVRARAERERPARASEATEPQPAGEPEGTPPSAPLPVHHVGVAVHAIDEAMRFYGDQLGLAVVDRQELADRSLKVAFVQAGNTLIELLEPTSPETTVARFLERRGPGLHHLCFGTLDIQAHLRELKDRGVGLLDEVARPGAHGDVAFLQPRDTFGVLVELIQLSHSARDEPAGPAADAEAAAPGPDAADLAERRDALSAVGAAAADRPPSEAPPREVT